MEPLEGRSLGEVLQDQGALDPQIAVQLMLPVIDALCCAHQHGVIHRDLKPDNIFITHVEPHRVHPKLLDFGIAKLSEARNSALRNATPGGVVMGRPAYMAPEQARGEGDVDVRADIWSLCIVLYEAVSGRAAFLGDNYNALLNAVIADPIEPLVDAACGEGALWTILERGLEKDRDLRFPTMRALGEALARWLAERGVVEDILGQSISRAWGTSALAVGQDRVVFASARPVVRAIPRTRTTSRRARRSLQFHSAPRLQGNLELPYAAHMGRPPKYVRAKRSAWVAMMAVGFLAAVAIVGGDVLMSASRADPTHSGSEHLVMPAALEAPKTVHNVPTDDDHWGTCTSGVCK
jgi:eukaryotic-like serine/threonine-protein kinase